MKQCTDIIYVDNQPYEFKYFRVLKKDGNLEYQCELLGSSVSTFNYRAKFSGVTLETAICSLGKELRRALDELSEM